MGRVAIVGAGLAGLSCARQLHRKGFGVTVWDKSRGLGGRLATRRSNGLSFDHGAQYVTARSTAFREFLAEMERGGSAAHWDPDDSDRSLTGLYVGQPGMSALLKPIALGLDLRLGIRVEMVDCRCSQWYLTSENGIESKGFDALVLAVPVPQAVSLLGPYSGILPDPEPLAMAPCWSVMMAFREPVAVAFDVARPAENAISWIARNSSKPARPRHADQWVIHASTDWSADHIEADKKYVETELARCFRELCDVAVPTPSFTAAHRWRYAFAQRPLGQDFVWDAGLRLGLVGDWCLGGRAESAFLSGSACGRLIN